MRTAPSLRYSWAMRVGHRTTAAAPSPMPEESSRLIGSAIMRALANWSVVIGLGNMALGLPTALRWALTEKPAKVGVPDAVFVHIAAHEEGVDGDEGEAVNGFPIGIGGHHEAGGGLGVGGIGHLFDAADDDKVMQPAGDGAVGEAQGSSAGAAGGFDLDGFDAAQADKVGDKRAEVLLAGEDAGEHVPHIEGVDGLGVGVLHGGEDGVVGQVAQRPVPMLVNPGLADADDAYVSHNVTIRNAQCSNSVPVPSCALCIEHSAFL